MSLPLYAKDDDREITRRAGILASRLSTSSATPSEKYSFSTSLLILTKGRTAREFSPKESMIASVRALSVTSTSRAASRAGSKTNLSMAK